jgi:dTDP-glucose pyrophosphorylase
VKTPAGRSNRGRGVTNMTSAACDKAVILARGLGTRMRRGDQTAPLDPQQAALAASGLKAMIPVGRPFLDYVLSALADAGYRRTCLVVAPEHEAIRDYYTRQSPPRRLQIEFAVQLEPRGTADAVAVAEWFAGRDPFVVLNSDNYYPIAALNALREATGPAAALFDWEALLAGNLSEERLRRFGVGMVDQWGRLLRIIEKPDEAAWHALPRPILVSMNCWRFESPIFNACRSIGLSPRGELELTDAVQYAIDVLGQPFRGLTIRAAVLDLTNRADIATVAERLAGVEVHL